MARKETSKNPPQFVFKGYVNINISESRSSEFVKYSKDASKVWLDYAQALVDGYAIKANFDDKTGQHRASLTGFHKTGDNFGYVIGGFADDWFTALAVVLFKHFHISGENWSDYAEVDKRTFG